LWNKIAILCKDFYLANLCL